MPTNMLLKLVKLLPAIGAFSGGLAAGYPIKSSRDFHRQFFKTLILCRPEECFVGRLGRGWCRPLGPGNWRTALGYCTTEPPSISLPPVRFSSYGKCNTKAQLRFPITMETVDANEKDRGSKAVSLRVFGHGQLAGLSWDALAEALGPNRNLPTHPDSANPSDRARFWDEFTRVAELQHARREGGMAEDYLAVPTMFKGYTLGEAALAVEKDFPSKFPTQLVEQFLSPSGPLGRVEFDSDVVPHIGNDDFVNKQVMLAQIIGWAVSTVSPKAFGAKWRHGRARPEEIAHALNIGESRFAGVQMAPRATRDLVQRLRLNARRTGADFTAYGNGAPNHPSWPAMHSAASSASVYLATVLKLTPAQLLEAQRLDCAVASFRSFAGVHYESDNMAGLAIGQEVLRAELPEFLVKNYGSDKRTVATKLQNVIAAHDWRTRTSCFY